MTSPSKPLGHKAYGSIPHIPGSRLGAGDHTIPQGQADIVTVKTRNNNDRVIVQEKLDGSCVAVARIGNEIVPLGRAGYKALGSPHEQHFLFHQWAMDRKDIFLDILEDGERVVGEWLAQAHGTRYDLRGRDPFVAFDIMTEHTRLTFDVFMERINDELSVPASWLAPHAISVERAKKHFGEYGLYGAIDPIEGFVWRAESRKKDKWFVNFLCKYVRPDKVDGSYFPAISGSDAVWNWKRPPSSTNKPQQKAG